MGFLALGLTTWPIAVWQLAKKLDCFPVHTSSVLSINSPQPGGNPVKIGVVIDEQEICPRNELHVGGKWSQGGRGGKLHWNLTVWQGESLATLTLVGDGGWGGCCCTTSWRRVYPRWRSLSDVVTSTPPCSPPPDFQPDGTLQSPISSIHPELCTSARSLPYDQAAEKERMEEEKMSRRNSRSWNRRHEPGLAASWWWVDA